MEGQEEQAQVSDDQPDEKSNKIFTIVIPALIVLLLVAGIVYFAATEGGLDRSAVEDALNQWSEELEQSSSAHGDEPTIFKYDKVEMEGGPSSRHAIIHHPFFQSAMGEEQENVVKITTKRAMLYPESIAFDKARLVLPDPIVVSSNGVDVGDIKTNTPIEIDGLLISQGKDKELSLTSLLPTTFIIESWEDDNTLNITMDTGASIKSTMSMGAKDEGGFSFDATNIKAINEDDETTELGKLFIEVSDRLLDQDKHDVSLNLDVQQLNLPEEDMPYGAITMNADVTYSGTLPKHQDDYDWVAMDGDMNINNFQIKNEDSYLRLKGTLSSKPGDMLPIGQANLRVGNFSFVRGELEKFGIIPNSNKQLFNVLFEQITGQKLADAKDVNVDLSREMNGSLKIGNITFEQALAIVLTGGKLLPKQPLGPVTTPPQE